METLVRGSNHRVVPRTHLQVRYGSPIALRRALRFFRFHSEGLVRIGCPADVPHLVPSSRRQRIALEVWRNHDDVDGIEYRSRWNNRLLCVALFDRAAGALEHGSTRVPLDDLKQIRPILRRYAIGVI